MTKLLQQFLAFYLKGDLQQAVEVIIKRPDQSFTLLAIESPIDKQLVNYIDAAVFGNRFDFPLQALKLLNLLVEKENKDNLDIQAALQYLPFELELTFTELNLEKNVEALKKISVPFQTVILQKLGKIHLELSEIYITISDIPEIFKSWIEFQLFTSSTFEKLKEAKPDFIKALPSPIFERIPHYPLRYDLAPLSISCDKQEIPVIIFQPIKNNLEEMLAQLKQKQALFVFETKAHFFQMLSINHFIESALEENHLLYILDTYPSEQLAGQNLAGFEGKQLKIFSFCNNENFAKSEEDFLSLLEELLKQSKKELSKDSFVADKLYKICKNILFFTKKKLLGDDHLPALYVKQAQNDWYDIHKGSVENFSMNPSYEQALEPLFSKISLVNSKRYVNNNKKKKLIAHVVTNIIDKGHAPTKILKNLILKRNKDLFDVLVFCTEGNQDHPLEYPYNNYISKASDITGIETIKEIQLSEAKLLRNGSVNSYLKDSQDLANILHEYDVDIAVFHGTNSVNLIGAAMSDVPVKVFFEHGTQCNYPIFDLAVVSSLDAKKIYEKHYNNLHTQIESLPFHLSLKDDWEKESFSKEFIGLPDDALIMTTISTKLDVRLTEEMLESVAVILQEVPKAWYVPIGPIKNVERIEKVFKKHNVNQRVRLLGGCPVPSQVARTMHLYLNEFPFGSCLGMLDAMAAGCPVISMYDQKGPQQARYAGEFMGMDRVIISGKPEDYIKLACELLNDPKKYQEWKDHTLRQYDQFSNVDQYVADFEKIILSKCK